MLRSARQLATDEKAFHPCPQQREAVRAFIEAAERKMRDALIDADSFDTRVACHAIGADEGLFSRVDAIRQVRNQKYTDLGRTRQDLDYSQRVLQEFSTLAAAWMQSAHGDLLQP